MMSEQKIIRFLYQKLLALYPQTFRNQFEESMRQTFNDLCQERKRLAGKKSLASFAGWMFIETSVGIIREHYILFKKGETMKNILTNHRPAAIIGFILALPYITISSLLMLGIEPPLGPLEPLLNNPDPDRPDPGSFVVLGAFLLSIVAFFIVRTPIVRTRKAGGTLLAHPVNLALSVVILSLILLVVGHIIVDQYPCWTGVPNCD